MRDKRFSLLLLALVFRGVTSAQVNPEDRRLVINGKAGDTTVVEINSRIYIDLEPLVRIGNGSIDFQGRQITLILPGPEANTQASTPEPEQSANSNRLTRPFMIAGIETIAQMREWASTMANAIQHGYGVTESWAAEYQGKAADSLRQASASTSTDGDRNALQLLTGEFHSVETWSAELVEAKENMDTAKYSMSSGALRNQPLSQKIITCGHFLANILGSAEFRDDPSCH